MSLVPGVEATITLAAASSDETILRIRWLKGPEKVDQMTREFESQYHDAQVDPHGMETTPSCPPRTREGGMSLAGHGGLLQAGTPRAYRTVKFIKHRGRGVAWRVRGCCYGSRLANETNCRP